VSLSLSTLRALLVILQLVCSCSLFTHVCLHMIASYIVIAASIHSYIHNAYFQSATNYIVMGTTSWIIVHKKVRATLSKNFTGKNIEHHSILLQSRKKPLADLSGFWLTCTLFHLLSHIYILSPSLLFFAIWTKECSYLLVCKLV